MKIENKPSPRARALVVPVFALALANSALAQQVRPETPAPEPSPAPPATEQIPAEEELLVLSPFTVTTTKDQGYFAANTLAGSRMNTNIADLGAAISVVTKQQLEDTGSLDINDVFRYEIGTEGSSTYTPTVPTMRGGGVADAVGGASFGNSTTVSTNATANRIRGLGSPTFALNYYPAISAIPFDSYNTSSIEISRGPNSMLFGMGSPAGIVNQSTAQAQTNRDSATISLRVDDRGSNRASFSFNKVLYRDKLAVYGAFLYNDQQFVRKPSYDTTRRQYGAITYRPFQKTKITAHIEGYSNDNRRPNSLTPRDSVTEWKNAGMPVFDAVTKTVRRLSDNQTVAMIASNANSPYAAQVRNFVTSHPNFNPALWNATANTYNGVSIFGTGAVTNVNSIMYTRGINFQNQARTIQRIADGREYDWYQPLGGIRLANGWGTNSTTTTYPFGTAPAGPNYVYSNPVWADMYDRYTTNSELWSAPNSTTQMKNWRYPGVSNKSIYDWEEHNLNQANYGNQRNTNYNVEIEQEIIPQLLHLSGGFFRQDFDSMQSYTIAQLDAGTLLVDTNTKMIDGSDNPFLGQVYVNDFDPDQYRTSQTVDNYRGMIAFTPDFTKHGGWRKWLGRHQVLGLASYMDDLKTSFRDRLQYVDGSQDGRYRYMNNPLDHPTTGPTGWNMANTSMSRQYYLSRPGDPYGAVTTTSGAWDNDRYAGQILGYDYTNQNFVRTDVVTDWTVRQENTGREARKLASYSGGWTGYLFEDRLVATIGVRRDINRTRATTNAGMTNQQKWVNGVYQYDDVFNRWNPWSRVAGTTSTFGGVLRPFTGWDSISRRASSGNLFWQFVENFGVSYNESDNFDAPVGTYVDVFGKNLPKPVGEGKDVGIQFSMMNNKLFARISWFEATNENKALVGGTAKTALDRLMLHTDTTAFRSWLENLYVINQGYNPTLPNWRQAFDNDASNRPAMEAQVAQWWQQSWDYYNTRGGTIAATGNGKSEGAEVQITYNPLPHWTMKFTGTKVETVNSGYLKEFDAWLAQRGPVWDNAEAADFLLPQYQSYANGYTMDGGRQAVIANFWDSTNWGPSDIRSDSINGWTTVRNYYNSVVTPQYSLAKDQDGQTAMGLRKYSWAFITNYGFQADALKRFSVGGAQRWADKSIIGYYGRASGADPLNPGVLDLSDTSRPIYDDAKYYTDLWVAYTRRIMGDKVRMKLQLNVADVFQDGGLEPVAVNYDGSVYAYRIVDSRQFMLTATFDF
jgi:hypothetical protein